jgi:hypothetical protein
MSMRIFAILAVGLLAACSSEAAPDDTPAATAAALTPGEYAMTSTITAFRSTDGATPLSKAKLGDVSETKACVAPDGTLDPAIFAEAGDTCTATNSYVREGRMSIQLSCTRPDAPGQIMPGVDAKFTADTFEGKATTTTYLKGFGDYALTRTIAAKRVGDCPAEVAAKS